MKTHIRMRLARLEAQLAKTAANEIDLKWCDHKSAVMAIVGFHAGKLTAGESLVAATARALDMAASELESAMSPDNSDGPNVWLMTLEKLNTIVAARGGRPITKNGSLILEGSRQEDDWRHGPNVLDKLYEEIPEEVKNRHRLLPYLADYSL